MLNSRHPLLCAALSRLRGQGPPYPEVTEVICRVPSTSFSQAPWYSLPAHLCRFRVRTIRWGYFLEVPGRPRNPISGNGVRPSSSPSRPTNINVVPIDYAFRPRLRDRLTLRRLTLRRNPWAYGESDFHTLYRYSCQHSRFRCLQARSRGTLRRPTECSATARLLEPAASVRDLTPVTFSARDGLFRPVSCYAFFKGWLLLSQPPGCHGCPTSFLT